MSNRWQGLHAAFAERAREHPGRTAVSASDGTLSYAELDRRSDRLAAALVDSGVGPGVLAGLCARRGTGLITGLLGILKAGGAYVPIDPDYPAEQIRFLVEDSKAAVLVVDRDSAAAVPAGLAATLVDVADPGPDTRPALPPPGRDQAAYALYTSGSTGRPKAVLVEHGNVLRLFESTAPWFGFGPDDVWTMCHSASFDFSVWEVWGALLHGGRLELMPAGFARSPATFRDALDRESVTVLNLTPSAFRLLLAAHPEAGRSLRLVVFGGERLDPGTVRAWLTGRDGAPRLVNMYGITETTVHVTYRPLTPADLDRPDRSPIGVPLPDLTVELVDERGEPVPDGTPGELRVTGPGVTRGYLGQAELTAARFGVDAGGARTYRTGDRAVRDADGELCYLGRIDEQLKVRGFRIEPGEVEHCLRQHPGVRDCALVAVPDADGESRLVACVVAEADEGQLAEQLAARCAAALPAHLRPVEYRVLDRLPLTDRGKLDRVELARSVTPEEPAADPAGPGPGDPVAVVLAIVRDVLNRPGLDPATDVFDVGATSLAFVRIIAETNRALGSALNGSELDGRASAATIAAAARTDHELGSSPS
jgi:amino acid adenylation domain-containing protein